VVIILKDKEYILNVVPVAIYYPLEYEKNEVNKNDKKLKFHDRLEEIGTMIGIEVYGGKGAPIFHFLLAFPFNKRSKYFAIPWDSRRNNEPMYVILDFKKPYGGRRYEIIEETDSNYVTVKEMGDFIKGEFYAKLEGLGSRDIQERIEIKGNYKIRLIFCDEEKLDKHHSEVTKIFADVIYPLYEME